jgi:hypothetical protein
MTRAALDILIIDLITPSVPGDKITTSEHREANDLNGVAPLDGTGKIPAIYIPGSYDDVLEFANLAAFPVSGTAGILYIAIDTNFSYRWTGATYVQVGGGSAVPASEIIAGVIEIATTAEAVAGLLDDRAITPLKLAQVLGSVIAYADAAEINAGADSTKFIAPDQLNDSEYMKRDAGKKWLVTAGTDTYTATATPTLLSYTAGMEFNVKFQNANTGAVTLNIDGLGAIPVRKDATTDLTSGEISTNKVLTLVYDGTVFQFGVLNSTAAIPEEIEAAVGVFNRLNYT